MFLTVCGIKFFPGSWPNVPVLYAAVTREKGQPGDRALGWSWKKSLLLSSAIDVTCEF